MYDSDYHLIIKFLSLTQLWNYERYVHTLFIQPHVVSNLPEVKLGMYFCIQRFKQVMHIRMQELNVNVQ